MVTDEDIKNKLGVSLRDMREKADKTLSEASGNIGISTKTLSRIEEGKHYTSFVNVAKLIDLYSGTLKDIIHVPSMKIKATRSPLCPRG